MIEGPVKKANAAPKHFDTNMRDKTGIIHSIRQRKGIERSAKHEIFRPSLESVR